VHRDGGYAPFVALPAINAIPVPDVLDAVEATVVPDAVATAVHVCGRRAGIDAGELVAVIGAGGGVGIHVVQVALLRGASVLAVELDPTKHGTLRELGATPVLPGTLGSDGGAPLDVAIDLVGSPSTLAAALGALGPGGRLIVVTTFRGVSAAIEPRTLVLGELAIVGSKYASRGEVLEAAALVSEGRVTPVIGSVVDPPQVGELHDALRSGSLLGRGAIRW
jgi:propanol-preferring alcohol dehydrogenase